MFSVIAIILLTFSSASFANADMSSLNTEFTKVSKEIKKVEFSKKFKYLDHLIRAIESERSKINDSNYESEKENLFKLNFLHDSISEIKAPFPKTDCDFKRKRLITNFSDYKTGKIHKNLITISKLPLSVIDSLCNN